MCVNVVQAALSTSFAFMLPIATPPNAIVFSSGELRVIDMLKPGAVANVMCSAVLWAYFQLLAPPEISPAGISHDAAADVSADVGAADVGGGGAEGSVLLWPLRAVLWGPTPSDLAVGEPDWAVLAGAGSNDTGC